jgi:hypothetical protein
MFDLIKRNLLKSVMLADGGFSLVAGIVLATFSAPLAVLLGPAFASDAVLGIGIFLLGWGLFHLAAGNAAQISSKAVWFAVIGDGLWIAASAALLIADWQGLTAIGAAAIAVIAVAVADIMLLKLIGLGRSQKQALA